MENSKSRISLFLASNRPANLPLLFENILETTADPSRLELLIKIDEGDSECREVILAAQMKYPFGIKYIETARYGGYFDLWIAYNDLLKVMHPETYYLAVVNDELRYSTEGWDLILDQYQGAFSDHIFRIRVSKNKLTNYFDIWQCGFSPDAYAFHTRRWIELGGDWNRGGTPDAYQQCIAFYLERSNYPYRFQINRDIPCMQISLKDEQPYQGITEEEYVHRTGKGWKYWFELQSFKMQLDCSRRAHLLKAHIEWGSEILIEDNKARSILTIKSSDGRQLARASYKISRIATIIRNLIRYPFKQYHCGGRWSELVAYYDVTYWRPFKSFCRKIPLLTWTHRRLKQLRYR